MDKEKTWITEANAAAVGAVLVWFALQLKIDMPAEVATSIGVSLLAVVNIAMRILKKKGLI